MVYPCVKFTGGDEAVRLVRLMTVHIETTDLTR